ncbi:helix-turn-helix transcriptional regulator [Ruegeria arenilitoris]|uniref:helix-turn-helix transcriptional regulator n=1 Tax=Ruegeria arenilitoris TaxID=1173585 RepID=UPI00147A5210|nr:helix-turn-helix domain-containing protein [Ruegeria arenilitoris]
MENIDPLLTAPESAQYLQVSVPTFWRRVADGTVPPAVKIGSLSRWPLSEIKMVIEDAKSQRFHASTTKPLGNIVPVTIEDMGGRND